jgi:tRNA (guanine37-N1)-methyltransferase
MLINIVTLYPQYFESNFAFGTLKKALGINAINLNIINLRDFAFDTRGSVDDTPYGGGSGMILRVDVLFNALLSIKNSGYKVMLSASGKKYTQKIAKSLIKQDAITLICGKFEGFDERILNFVDLELSVGDYVLSGGEIAALVVVDSVTRLLSGVLGNEESIEEESFSSESNLLEYPHYTKPQTFNGLSVPEVLISGNHKEIKSFRENEKLTKTKKNRPDLVL